MKSLARRCAARPVGVIMVLCAVMMAGGRAASVMPLSRLPELKIPRLVVEASAPGLPAAAVRSLVAAPLEDALASAKGLVGCSSVSRDGGASLILDFAWGEDPARAASKARELLDAAYPSLPEAAERPRVRQSAPYDDPIAIVVAVPLKGELAALRRFAELSMRQRFRRVEGVGAAMVVGGSSRELAVVVDMDRAAARGLTVLDAARAIASEQLDLPAGSVMEGGLELVALARGRATDADGLAKLRAQGPQGPFRVGDIAEVFERDASRLSLFVVDGQEAVALKLYLRAGADPRAAIRGIRAAIAELEAELGGSASLRLARDGSRAAIEAVRNLGIAGALGALMALAALLALLGDPRGGLLAAGTIPVSVAAALAILGAAGRSLNAMSLGGIGLAVGMISDNAVITLDAISSRFAAGNERPSPDGVADAAATVMAGSFGSAATTAVVFVPILFLPGALGGLYGDLALAVIAANLAGWLAAALALPALYRMTWRKGAPRRGPAVERSYRRILAAAMRRPGAALALSSAAACVGILAAGTRELSFMPLDAASELVVSVDFEPGTDPDGMVERAKALSAALAAVPGVRSAYGGAGAETDDSARRADPSYARERLELWCGLSPGVDPVAASTAAGAVAAATLPPGMAITVGPPQEPAAVTLGLDSRLVVAVRGETPSDAAAKAELAALALAAEAGPALDSVEQRPAGAKPRVELRPLRDEGLALGVGIGELAQALRAATDGAPAGAVELEGRETPVRVFAAGAGDGGGSVARAAAIPVAARGGAGIPASTVASFALSEGPAALARLGRFDVVYLEARAVPGHERKLAGAVDRVGKRLEGVRRADESAFKRYAGSLAAAAALVIVLLYLTLGAQFESFTLPFAIMAAIPLGMAGAGPALAATGLGLDSGSALGLLVLFGVSVNGAIVLYEAFGAYRAAGASPAAAAFAGANARVRPSLAAAATTVLALLPVAMAPAGAAQRSMSVAMMGGVAASTALTLIVFPIVLSGMCKR
jgi:multidrug efflux pump subunit AcrB